MTIIPHAGHKLCDFTKCDYNKAPWKKKTNYPQQDEEVFGPVANWVSSVAKIPWKAARLFAERWGWGRQAGDAQQ